MSFLCDSHVRAPLLQRTRYCFPPMCEGAYLHFIMSHVMTKSGLRSCGLASSVRSLAHCSFHALHAGSPLSRSCCTCARMLWSSFRHLSECLPPKHVLISWLFSIFPSSFVMSSHLATPSAARSRQNGAGANSCMEPSSARTMLPASQILVCVLMFRHAFGSSASWGMVRVASGRCPLLMLARYQASMRLSSRSSRSRCLGCQWIGSSPLYPRRSAVSAMLAATIL